MFNDFLNLIFPKLCSSCGHSLLKKEQTICLSCQITLPKTNYHLDINNPVNKLFWGRVRIEMAASFYLFTKKSKVQNVLHQLKYRDDKNAGFVLGKLYGYELKRSNHFQRIECIVPVPLHLRKLKKRGYNQSEWIAEGIASSMKIPTITNSLFRKIDSETQTKKKRYSRWENVENIFDLKNAHLLRGKSVLLVDDVITTGATLEACANVLLKEHCKVYIAVLASA